MTGRDLPTPLKDLVTYDDFARLDIPDRPDRRSASLAYQNNNLATSDRYFKFKKLSK